MVTVKMPFSSIFRLMTACLLSFFAVFAECKSDADASKAATATAEVKVLAKDGDFESLSAFPPKPITHWRWTEDEKKNASKFSSTELVRDPSGKMLYSLKINPGFPGNEPYYPVFSLGVKYFPPEADAIRIKVKPVSGKMVITFGGPTAYFGNSDAFARPAVIDSSKDGTEWKTVEFSLHEGLFRNFRRASFSAKAPWIYYNRWSQEPTFFYIMKGSEGEMRIQDIEIISKGVGKDFQKFKSEDVKPVGVLVKFSDPDAGGRVFTLLFGETMKDFDLSWNQKDKIVHVPPIVSIADEPGVGKILRGRAVFLEEMKAIGVKVKGVPDGNALKFRIKVDSELQNKMLPDIECQPIDFLFYTSTEGEKFDWGRFAPSEELRKGPGLGYGCNLTYEKIRNMNDLSISLYHARRFLKKGEWTDIVIPLSDFLCIYGSGDMGVNFQNQLSPEPGKMIAVTFLAPWPRRGRGETAISVQDVSLVTVRGRENGKFSYYRIPDMSAVKTVKSKNGRFSFMLLPGESDLPAEIRKIIDENGR